MTDKNKKSARRIAFWMPALLIAAALLLQILAGCGQPADGSSSASAAESSIEEPGNEMSDPGVPDPASSETEGSGPASVPDSSSDSSEDTSTGDEPSVDAPSEDVSTGTESSSGEKDPPDTQAPVFVDAENGVLPELFLTAGEKQSLTDDVRVEDDRSLSRNICLTVADSGGYDPSMLGTYTVRYEAEDEAGNRAEAVRKVTVLIGSGEVTARADILLEKDVTPFSFNDPTALAYTSSGTSFRTKDSIQIMETAFFLEQYELHKGEHTNNGKVPFFPNGVLLFVDGGYRIRKARIAAGEQFELQTDGKWKTGPFDWTNTIDASSGGGLFKGVLKEIKNVLGDGGYLIFCGNYGDQNCRRFLIRNLLMSGYEAGAIGEEMIDVTPKGLTIGWDGSGTPSADPGKDPVETSDPPAGDDPPAAQGTTLSAADVINGFPVYTGKIAGEVSKPTAPDVFAGAWYRKAVSSRDAWAGVEATVTLPSFHIARYSGSYDASLDVDPNADNLDNPSVYLGGNSNYESDIGLSLSRGLIKTATGIAVSKGAVCFRPFWRYITKEDQDAGGYDVHGGKYAVSVNGNNCIANYHYKYTEYYYLPGDTLRIMVFSPEENALQLAIQVISVSTDPSSVAIRKANGWKDPADFLSPVFRSKGYGTGKKTEYKRVCAIDQKNNEGKDAIATETEVKSVIWQEVYLYRMVDGQMRRIPMTEQRTAYRNAPDDAHTTVRYDGTEKGKGGEIVDIHPGYKN